MTAEIAIINRSAVTLATDSAVTLTVRGAEKIYNAADKLFELSRTDPIGIMVYNNLEFMGVSLEIAVKEFRGKVAADHYDSVSDASDAFFTYLQTNLAPDAALQADHAKAILRPFLIELRDTFDKVVRKEIRKTGLRKTDYAGIFNATLKRFISDLEALEIAECFTGMSDHDLLALYSDPVNELIKDVFEALPLTDDHKTLLRKLCALALQRDKYSESSTGMVFAGFGEKEMFPSLVAYQTDGVIANRLKKRQIEKVLTNRREVTGEILPFAQREMVDRFLSGIDPAFERGIEHYLKVQMEATGNTIVDSLPRTSTKTKRKLKQDVVAATEVALERWREKMLPAVKQLFLREVQDMIFLMPKQELAVLAQELINLTSVKRKFSSGKESVGGPIDVAVISRIDGFVWVRRKHYFEPNLNPSYFHRKYGPAHA